MRNTSTFLTLVFAGILLTSFSNPNSKKRTIEAKFHNWGTVTIPRISFEDDQYGYLGFNIAPNATPAYNLVSGTSYVYMSVSLPATHPTCVVTFMENGTVLYQQNVAANVQTVVDYTDTTPTDGYDSFYDK